MSFYLSKYSPIFSATSLPHVISTERQRVEKSIGKARNKVRFLHAFATAHLVEMTYLFKLNAFRHSEAQLLSIREPPFLQKG